MCEQGSVVGNFEDESFEKKNKNSKTFTFLPVTGHEYRILLLNFLENYFHF